MKNSKLYSILEHFDKYEQNRCRKYISSPYFNKNNDLSSLYEILIKHINSQSEKELPKEVIWKKLQAPKSFDDVRFRKYFSDLLKLIEGFLAQQIYEENPLHKATYLIDAVGEKKMEKLYNSTMKTARRLSNQQPFKPASFYFYQYQIENNYYNLTQFGIKRFNKSNLEDIGNNLDNFYFAEKLRLYCTVLTQKKLASHTYDILFIDEIIEYLHTNNLNFTPPVAIYYHVLLSIIERSDNHESYFKLKTLLGKYGLLFPQQEASEIYTYALNYCTQQINRGNQLFLNEIFDVFKDLLEKEIIIEDNQLAPWHYKNIVVVALRLGKYDWAENFIHKYKLNLPENSRDNAVTYNLAQLNFYQKKYSEVIRLLQTVEYEEVAYNLDSKSMLLATYYETQEEDALDALLESFRAFLNRHKDIPENRRKGYKNLIRFTKKLTRLLPRDKKAIEKIKEEIADTKIIASKKWLNEKIAELE